MSSAAVERYEDRAPALIDERTQKSIEYQARALAILDNRLKGIADADERRETAIGLAITLHNYHLPITPTNGKKFHLINGEWSESAQLLVGLLEMHGHEVRVVEEGEERAVVRGWRHGRGMPHEVTYTYEQARRSHAFDEWVEQWEQKNGKWRKVDSLVIAIDGEEVNRPLPQWAEQQVARGRVKRNEAWFSWRSDMYINRAVRRLAKRMGADALLGVGIALDDDEPAERESPPPAPRPESSPQPEEDIEDAEVVAEPAAEPAPSTAEAGRLDLGPERPFTE